MTTVEGRSGSIKPAKSPKVAKALGNVPDAISIRRAIKAMRMPVEELMQVHQKHQKYPRNSIDYLSARAGKILNKWRKLAASDHNALRSLASFLLMESDFLNNQIIYSQDLKHYLAVTTRATSWPGEISVDKDVKKRQATLTQALCLGKYAALQFGKKQWSKSTPAVAAALELIRLMDRCGGFGMLPPLSRITASVWWSRAEYFFEYLYGVDFENHPLFAHCWNNAAYKDQPKARALIRRDIKKQIKQAFTTIAPPSKGV